MRRLWCVCSLFVFNAIQTDVSEICDLLGHYAAYSGNSLPTFRYNLLVSSASRRKPEVTQRKLIRSKTQPSLLNFSANGRIDAKRVLVIKFCSSFYCKTHLTNSFSAGTCSMFVCLLVCLFVCFWRDGSQWARVSSFTRFLDYTQRRATVGRTSLDE